MHLQSLIYAQEGRMIQMQKNGNKAEDSTRQPKPMERQQHYSIDRGQYDREGDKMGPKPKKNPGDSIPETDKGKTQDTDTNRDVRGPKYKRKGANNEVATRHQRRLSKVQARGRTSTSNTRVTAPTQGTPQRCRTPSQTRAPSQASWAARRTKAPGQTDTTAHQTRKVAPGGCQKQGAAAAQGATTNTGGNVSSLTQRAKFRHVYQEPQPPRRGGLRVPPTQDIGRGGNQQQPAAVTTSATSKSGDNATSPTPRRSRQEPRRSITGPRTSPKHQAPSTLGTPATYQATRRNIKNKYGSALEDRQKAKGSNTNTNKDYHSPLPPPRVAIGTGTAATMQQIHTTADTAGKPYTKLPNTAEPRGNTMSNGWTTLSAGCDA